MASHRRAQVSQQPCTSGARVVLVPCAWPHPPDAPPYVSGKAAACQSATGAGLPCPVRTCVPSGGPTPPPSVQVVRASAPAACGAVGSHSSGTAVEQRARSSESTDAAVVLGLPNPARRAEKGARQRCEDGHLLTMAPVRLAAPQRRACQENVYPAQLASSCRCAGRGCKECVRASAYPLHEARPGCDLDRHPHRIPGFQPLRFFGREANAPVRGGPDAQGIRLIADLSSSGATPGRTDPDEHCAIRCTCHTTTTVPQSHPPKARSVLRLLTEAGPGRKPHLPWQARAAPCPALTGWTRRK